MESIIANAKQFRDAISAIANIVDEAVFYMNEEGIRVKAIDPSQVSMVSFFMPSNAFEQYSVKGEEKAGIDIARLMKILDRANANEKMLFKITSQLTVSFIKDKKKRTFKMALLDLGEGLQKEPPIEYKNYVKISDSALKEAIKDAKLISPHIRFLLEDGILRIEVSGENTKHTSELEEGDEVQEIHAESSVRVTFPLSYLEYIVKSSPSGSTITLYLENDSPLKLQYNVGGAVATYYLAPRMEVE